MTVDTIHLSSLSSGVGAKGAQTIMSILVLVGFLTKPKVSFQGLAGISVDTVVVLHMNTIYVENSLTT